MDLANAMTFLKTKKLMGAANCVEVLAPVAAAADYTALPARSSAIVELKGPDMLCEMEVIAVIQE